MRIAYVVSWSERLDAGVMRKVEAQSAHWRHAGHIVRVFVLRRVAERRPSEIVDDDRHIVQYGSMRERLRAVRRLFVAIDTWQPSLVYARYDLWWPSLPRLARRVPIVIEVNTDNVLEQRLGKLRKLPRRMFNRASQRALLSASAGLVFVTHELARNRRFDACTSPRTVIANSFDLDSVRSSRASATGTRAVFLGGPQPWQGVDEVISMARLFPDWEFDLIGVQASDVSSVPPNVRCHGFLSKHEYEPILGPAHVAVGSLAVYRKGLHEASPLKVREYLAYGLPAIIGYLDTDFPNGAPFLLRIPNESGAVGRSADAIGGFVHEWRGQRVERSSIHHIDMSVKEAKRLAFFTDVVTAEP